MTLTGRDEGGMEWRGCRQGRSSQAGCGFGGRASGCADPLDMGREVGRGHEDGGYSLGPSDERRAGEGCGEHAGWAVRAGTCGASEQMLHGH